MNVAVPPTVSRLLAARIQTFDKLDVVIALRRAPRMTASVELLCAASRLPREVVRTTVVALTAAGLVELTRRGEVHLLVPSPEDAAALHDLDYLYAHDRVVLARALGELAIERIRRMAPEAFVDPASLPAPEVKMPTDRARIRTR